MIDPNLTDLQFSKPMIKPSASHTVSGPDTPSSSVDASAEPTLMEETSEDVTVNRQQPIPPPSEPMQFRAIGLVQGKYIPSEERFNRGSLEVEDGVQLDAVLLGQVMSLVKKYVDLEQSYLWVVYPRTREKEQTLHLQIVGVWSADGFGPITGQENLSISSEAALAEPIEDGYFSVRGQIVYQATDKELLYVKIQQTPRKSKAKDKSGSRDKRGERDKAFKLRVNGVLPQKAVGYFWDLHVKRQGSDLILQEGTSIAQMPVQRHKRPPQRPSKPYSKMPNSAKPNLAYRAQGSGTGVNATPPRPVQKPIKRQNLSN
jgi:hypothetical protein